MKNNAKDFKPSVWYENDFVIMHRKYGVLVVEVKGGEISFLDGVVYQKNRKTLETKPLIYGNDPIDQGKRGIYYYRSLFQNSIPDIKDRLSINFAVWFPDVIIDDYNVLPQDYKSIKEAILDNKSFSNIEKSLEKAFNLYGSSKITQITDHELSIIKNIIAPTVDLITTAKVARGEIEYQFLQLTREQQYLLDYISEIRFAIIKGAAGTGKTLLAIEAAKRAANELKKVLFLCYNRFLIEYIKSTNEINGVDYYNINGFVSEHSKVIVSNNQERANEFGKLVEVMNNYDCIIVDEAQDFESEEIEFLQDYSYVEEKKVLIFYDENQIVYGKSDLKWIKNSECKLILSKNCRNTYDIACTSHKVIDANIKGVLTTIKGEQPKVYFTSDPLLELEKLILYYKSSKYGYDNEDITILTLASEEASIINNVKKIGGCEISKTKKTNSIFFTSARKFKGLESSVVIVVDINEKSFSDPLNKRVFYVACSRAIHSLSLVILESDTTNISKYISKTGSIKGSIANYTRTKIGNLK